MMKVKNNNLMVTLFSEVVFNESILEFLRKKSELSNYFEETEENIYDYIPPQNTNQIYTPKWVVQKMVQQLEDENQVFTMILLRPLLVCI